MAAKAERDEGEIPELFDESDSEASEEEVNAFKLS